MVFIIAEVGTNHCGSVDIAKKISPSQRGELEISDINKIYLNQGELNVKVMGRGFAWLDTGTHDTLIEASNFIKTVEKRQGLKIACLEEIAYNKGWISKNKMKYIINNMIDTNYRDYLKYVIDEKVTI